MVASARAGLDTAGAGWKVVLLSVLLALGCAMVMLFLPLGTSVTATRSLPDGDPPNVVVRRHTLTDTEGPRALLIAAIPVGLTLVALPFRKGMPARVVRGVAAGLLTILVVLGSLSVGIFFLPAALAMWVATFL